ncbi:MAG TPA: helix-turn-helix domain-containing protein [Longimicrobiaceae bacterium]|nr:helix-turn-helix domain-containing protein [Longimicrobiaceae bacterium]
MPATAERLFVHTEEESRLWPPAETPAEAYRAVLPCVRLRGLVERVHLGREWIPPERAVEERVLPDGAVHLIFNLGVPPRTVGGGVPAACEALGANCEPAVILMAGHVEQVGVRLRPGGLAPLLGVPAGELAGRPVALEELWGARAGEALERLAAAPPGPARVAAVEDVLVERAGAGDPRPQAVAAEAVRRIGASGGRMRVRDLAAGLGVGERRLAQLFHAHVGLTPKAACRLARFRATLSLLQREPGLPWSRVALRCGFYDQSHLVNEFRALAGLSPTAFRERAGFGFLQDGAAAPP